MSKSMMDRWVMAVCADLGLDPATADVRTVLDMAREVAHKVDRPAAPVTAYLLGMAVGRGLSLAVAAERVGSLATGWDGSGEE
ncbi:MAG TPA: DUF6457 domain-containing protein [Streptosporangiaceae bacterium]|jgi:enoyl-CoA hydratase/carnithine racemase|nr:DUF6457 domain-containing protein [Streptosporangiaceae bacterium]